MFISFNQLPPEARVWVYQANRNLTAAEEQQVSKQLESFCENWQAHGAHLKSSFQIKYNRFIIIGVDEAAHIPTGCSIDASVHKLKHIEAQLALDFLDRTQIAYLENNTLSIALLPELKTKVLEGKIKAETPTFNNLVATIEEFNSDWIVPAKDSWLSKYFKG